jgi:hypothetical protein
LDCSDASICVSLIYETSMESDMSISKQMLLATVAFGAVGLTNHANAQDRYVATYGDNANACTRSTPCRTFEGALPKTPAGGTINCLENGNYDRVRITKSITISCENVGATLEPASVFQGVSVEAGPTDVVVLRGLNVVATAGPPGIVGIEFRSGGSLVVEDCSIRNTGGGPVVSAGIQFEPSTGTSILNIRNTLFTGNGTGTQGAGVQIAPTGSGSANVTISNSNFSGNVVGIRADSNRTSGSIDLSVVDTVVADGKYHGIVALAATGRVFASVADSTVTNNLGEGLRAVGANARIRVGTSWVTGNGTGVVSASGGRVQSYGDNKINGNTVDGAVSLPILQMK